KQEKQLRTDSKQQVRKQRRLPKRLARKRKKPGRPLSEKQRKPWMAQVRKQPGLVKRRITSRERAPAKRTPKLPRSRAQIASQIHPHRAQRRDRLAMNPR